MGKREEREPEALLPSQAQVLWLAELHLNEAERVELELALARFPTPLELDLHPCELCTLEEQGRIKMRRDY